MTVAQLIGLEERERIDGLKARGREIGFAYMMRSVLSEKMEGLKEVRSNWERTIDRVPGRARGWAALSEQDKEQIGIILQSIADENAKVLAAREKAATQAAKREARRRQRRAHPCRRR